MYDPTKPQKDSDSEHAPPSPSYPVNELLLSAFEGLTKDPLALHALISNFLSLREAFLSWSH
jgi:hypothetical protein